MERRQPAQPPVLHTCTNCEHYRAGDLDAQVNWVNCANGHCLIANSEKTSIYKTEHGKKVYVTEFGWTGEFGFGEPMLDRIDCPDWKEQGFRLDLPSMEY